MKAIVMQGEPGKVSVVSDWPYPKSRSGYVLVDVKAIALNPGDWKHIDYMNTKDCVIGCDYSGVIAEIGTGYNKPWKIGDRICGLAHGANDVQVEDGAFAERIAVKADIQMHIPDHMSFEEAATLGAGVVTCGQGLFQEMGLKLPSSGAIPIGEKILIYGGSSATGSLGIQFAKLAGYTPITTCSPHNFELVLSLGAVAAFDYGDVDCAVKIRDYCAGGLKYVWDTISLPTTAAICADVIAPGGQYGTIVPVKAPRDDIKVTFSLAYTAFGERIQKFSLGARDNIDDFEFTKRWIEVVESLLQEGRVTSHIFRASNNLADVLEGLDLMRRQRVSGQKLVYVIAS